MWQTLLCSFSLKYARPRKFVISYEVKHERWVFEIVRLGQEIFMLALNLVLREILNINFFKNLLCVLLKFFETSFR